MNVRAVPVGGVGCVEGTRRSKLASASAGMLSLAAATLKFFDWAFAQGDKMAADLDYVPLPDSVEDLVRKQWSSIKDAAGKPIAFK